MSDDKLDRLREWHEEAVELGYEEMRVPTEWITAALQSQHTSMGGEIERRVLATQQERILTWLAAKQFYQGNRAPILLSELEAAMGTSFSRDAFEELVRAETLRCETPEARPGDSGRQFWNFAHWAALNEGKLREGNG
jgi:hypothetical protein